jgi:NADH-quinone oxidoreductase subunit M
MLWLVQRLFYGPESQLASSRPAHDLQFRQLAVLWPLAVLMLVMGLAPSLWLASIQTGVHPPLLNSATGVPIMPASVSSISPQGEAQR